MRIPGRSRVPSPTWVGSGFPNDSVFALSRSAMATTPISPHLRTSAVSSSAEWSSVVATRASFMNAYSAGSLYPSASAWKVYAARPLRPYVNSSLRERTSSFSVESTPTSVVMSVSLVMSIAHSAPDGPSYPAAARAFRANPRSIYASMAAGSKFVLVIVANSASETNTSMSLSSDGDKRLTALRTCMSLSWRPAVRASFPHTPDVVHPFPRAVSSHW